jgi:hypothetical protein
MVIVLRRLVFWHFSKKARAIRVHKIATEQHFEADNDKKWARIGSQLSLKFEASKKI